MQYISYLLILMWMSTLTNALQDGHQNQNKVIGQIIRELPDYDNMTVFNKDTINPSKCVRHNDTTKTLQNLYLENDPNGTVLSSINTTSKTGTYKSSKSENFQIQPNENFMARVGIVVKESLWKSKDMVSNEFYDVDESDYSKNDEGNLYHDFDDFDEIKGDVRFKDFGSNLRSEMFIDEENFNYYEYMDDMVQQMNNRLSAAAGGPNGINAKPEYYDDMDYADFGTLFLDEQLIDYEEYLETLTYFKLLDKLTNRNSNGVRPAEWHSL